MSDRLKKEFENFEVSPDKKLWRNIKSQLIKPKFNWLAFSTISGAILIATGIIVLFLSPIIKENKESISFKNEINNYSTTPVKQENKIITQENKIELSQNNIKIEKTNQAKDNFESSIISTNKQESNTIIKDNNIQLKQDDNQPSKVINTNSAISIKNIAKPIQFVQEEEYISTKSPVINNDDTVTTRQKLFVPNSFTPNEAINNIFKPAFTNLKSYEMCIYNRSGVLLFTSRDISKGWNGYFKGHLCDCGVYVYVIKFENYEGKAKPQMGTVNLIR